MGNRVTFRVYDENGNDVTNTHFWYVDAAGDLYAETTESGLVSSEDLKLTTGHTYKAVIE